MRRFGADVAVVVHAGTGVETSLDTARRSACATLLSAVVLLVGCSAPEASGVKVIVGARLEQPAMEYSVVVIADGKFRAVGSQATTPVPKGAELTDGKGSVLSGAIVVGQPANLMMRDAKTGTLEGTMIDGEWAQ